MYRASADAMAWLPVFFLYFSEKLTLPEVLVLESVYYLAVVLTEVPSGYLSDTLGRRRTLLLSGIALLVAYLCFLLSPQFAGFAAGQVLLALSIAFRSGTDTAFHYESLQALNRESEYGDREATAGKAGFASTALAALAGGALGSLDLALPYYLSLLTACVALAIVYCFKEPAETVISDQKNSFYTQLRSCIGYVKQPFIKWIFIYSVFMYTFVHVPYEFYQPYLALLDNNHQLPGSSAALAAGILFALTAAIAAITSAYSMVWQSRFGLLPLLKYAAAIELIIILLMACMLHPVIALSVIIRSGPMAVITAPINASIAPLISNAHRATFLSLKSLAGRLAFAVLLLAFSLLVAHKDQADWNSLSLLLWVSVITGVIGLLALHFTSKKISTSPENKTQP